MPASLTYVRRLVLGLICTIPLPVIALAQSPAHPSARSQESSAPFPKSKSSKRPGSSRGWRVSPSLQVEAAYDDNIFLLSPGKKDNVGAPTSSEAISGRYADMRKASDVLTTMSAGLAVKGPGVNGKPFIMTPEVSYELYTQNTHRSNLSLALSFQQEAWADSRIRLQGRLKPTYFARNYLADAVDQDSDGSITEVERIYARGEYREGDLVVDYRVPLTRSTRKHPFGASVQLAGGYYSRSHDAPLQGRNLSGPIASAKLLLDLGRRVDLDVGYEFSTLGAAVSNQVLLLNEADFGQDLNGNGSNSDIDARVLTPVDRSRNEHSLTATLHLEPSRPVDITLGFDHRWRRYTSVELFDVTNRGRRDSRSQVSGDIRFRMTKDLRFRLGGVHSAQKLNRGGDPGSTGEIDDYNRSQASLGLSYEL